MEADEQCRDCWCLNHREPAGCPTGPEAKKKMKDLVSAGEVHGLLAYLGHKPVGWIAIDPLQRLVGHDCHRDTPEWSIHCLFVRDGSRGQGLSQLLIEAAIDFAASHGATLISAFPIPAQNRMKFPSGVAEFSGRLSTYENLVSVQQAK